MKVAAILLRWYRSFNVTALGPDVVPPGERWHHFGDELFPFVRVPLDRRITSIVGGNESGKSHLLSAVSKVFNGEGLPTSVADKYEIKDICRYCGFSPLDELWPEIGIELRASPEEAASFEQGGQSPEKAAAPEAADEKDQTQVLTVILNGGKDDDFATVYKDNTILRTFDEDAWFAFSEENLPSVQSLDSRLALPNEVHIDELLDLYNNKKPVPVIEPLGVQDLWRELEGIQILDGTPVNEATAKRLDQMKKSITKSARKALEHEGRLVHLLFDGVLGVKAEHLERMRKYSVSERGYVSSMNEEINERIERELDITQYWDQDEDFKLTVNYKAGTFHFQITDRTGSTYTFNERSSGLRYFLSYYIQAKAIERIHAKHGSIILMDEPDNFLSASGQRSLLRVFEALVGAKVAHGSCQLIYTTHSPFLINRNFPGRIRLVRKGDGTEGTQYVPRSAVRRFEPIRSALSIDSADTLFLGSTNVILEGPGDQKLLTACIQRFGVPGKLDEFLDLNSVTLVASGGAPFAPELVRKAVKGDEKPPIVVALLDGDERGANAVASIAKEIDPKQAATLRDVKAGTQVFEVLEDLVPIKLLDRALSKFAGLLGDQYNVLFDGSGGGNRAKQIDTFCRTHLPATKDFTGIEIRSGVIDSLVDVLGEESFFGPGLDELRANVVAVCGQINQMVDHARRNAGRRSLKYMIRLQVDSFFKRHSLGASKGELRQLLTDLHHAAFGRGNDYDMTRLNCDRLLERLEAENQNAADSIDLTRWQKRLRPFAVEPWAGKPNWLTQDAPGKPATVTTQADGADSTTH